MIKPSTWEGELIFHIANLRWQERNKKEVKADFYEEEVRKFIYSLLKEERKKLVEDICILIDKIESQSETNTLEEWKQYKHIRNGIRDKFLDSLEEE